MKKILLSIVAFIYFALSVRATIHLHDCVEIFGASIIDLHSDQKNTGPCNNDANQCKLETEHKVLEAAFKSLRTLSEVLSFGYPGYALRFRYAIKQDYLRIDIPLRTHKIALFILHCIFRI
jgi:hypothetical protein